jgi:arylsulfatase A-like enzyme
MARASFPPGFLVLLVALALGCGRTRAPEPDIVIFVVDTLRADHLGLYGHERPSSPRLDALAGESWVFDRAFSHSSWTLPATASLLTGRLPAAHGATRDPLDEFLYSPLDERVPTLAERLTQRGRRAAAWVNNVYLAPEFGLARGFEHYDYNGSSGLEERSAADAVDLALEWLKAHPEPTFVYLHVMEPHLPYLPPAPYKRAFTGPGEIPVPVPFGVGDHLDRLMNGGWRPGDEEQASIQAMYDEEILTADAALGRLVDGLAAQGRWDRTLLAFTSDHGEEFWDHGSFEHGHSMYGEILRVPLLLRVPGQEARRVEFPVQHADLFQTLLGLAGAPRPAGSVGDDLRGLLSAPPPPRPLLSEDCLYGPPLAAITLGERRLIANLADRTARLYALDARGQADRRVEDSEAQAAETRALLGVMEGLRGDLAVHRPTQAKRLDPDSIEKLRALGYLQE